MATLTLSIPNDLKEKLDRHSEINWSEYLKKKLAVRVEQLIKFESLVKEGKI